jgi:hypothetical protein
MTSKFQLAIESVWPPPYQVHEHHRAVRLLLANGILGSAMEMRLQATPNSEQSGIPTPMSRVSAGIVTVHIMTVKLGTVVFLALFAAHSSGAQAAQPPKTSARIIGSFFIDPSSTSIKGGKASLIVGALRRNAGTYIGDYQLTVSPYFFMSEKGTLSMIVSDESLRKLTQGIPVSVTGQATTKKSGKTRAVNAKLTPAAKDRGSVTFSFIEDDTKLIFKTFYQFGNY